MRIVNTLLEITVYSTVIFGILYLIKLCLGKKLSPALHYALWFVLVARLMLPITIDSGFHLFTLPASAPAVSAPVAETVPQQLDDGSAFDAMLPLPIQPDTADGTMPAQTVPAASAPQTAKRLTTAQIVLLVWMVGVGACAVWLTVLYASLLYRIKRNRAKPSKKLMALLEEVKAELGIRSRIRLICLYEYGTPALMFPNVILMPVDALAAMNTEQVKLALRHELTHYQRGDQFTGLLLSLLQAVYWFNPLVWIGFRMMRADMETVCDQMVTRRFSKAEKNEYASLILNLFAQPAHRQIVLGMAQRSTRKLAEQRIRGIFMRRSSKPLAKAVCIMMVLVMAVGCFTTACVPAANDKSASIIGGADGPTSVFVSNQPGNETIPDTRAALPTQIMLASSGRWQDEWTSGANHIEIDANVIVPDLQSAKTLTLAPRTFDAGDIERFLAMFFDGQEVKNFNPTTKSDWETLLTDERKLLSELEAGKAPEDDLRPLDEQIASCKERIASIEIAMSSADENEVSTAPLRLHMLPRSTYESSAEFYSKGDDGREYRMIVSQTNGVGSLLWYGEKDYAYQPVSADEIDEGALPDLAAAQALVQNYMSQLGISDYALSRQSVLKDGDRYAYSFTYTRSYGAMPYLSIQAVPSGLDSTKQQEDSPRIFHESLGFVTDGMSIAWAEWRYPFTIAAAQDTAAPMMPAEQAKERAKEYLDQYMTKYDGDDLTLVIMQLRLGGCYAPGDSAGEYAYVPTWEAVGYLRQSDGSRYLGDAEHPLSMLTMNAMDGSVVHKALVN